LDSIHDRSDDVSIRYIFFKRCY